MVVIIVGNVAGSVPLDNLLGQYGCYSIHISIAVSEFCTVLGARSLFEAFTYQSKNNFENKQY